MTRRLRIAGTALGAFLVPACAGLPPEPVEMRVVARIANLDLPAAPPGFVHVRTVEDDAGFAQRTGAIPPSDCPKGRNSETP